MELHTLLETREMLCRPVFALVNSNPLPLVFWECWRIFCFVFFTAYGGLPHFLAMELLSPGAHSVDDVDF